MTYKLNPEIRKIESKIVLIYPDCSRKEYSSGTMLAEDAFDKRFLINKLKAVNSTVEIYLVEQKIPVMNWCGEENVECLEDCIN